MKSRLMILLLLLFFIGAITSIIILLSPVDSLNEKKILLNVELGSSPSKIATMLKENELIKSELVFKIYLMWTGRTNQLQAGKYELTKKMNVEEIVNRLTSGKIPIETITFTIPEGYTVSQIAELLEKEAIVNKNLFLELISNGEFDYDFVKSIPKDGLPYRLEGYLFPKTYEIVKGTTEEEIIDIMLSQFEKEWNDDWDAILVEEGLTLHEMITLASIIEREVMVDQERPIVAGVLYNRLRDNWNLQVDATIQYILGKQKEIITYDDLKKVDPFNTYLNKGLPPGPIASPGIESIKAALQPNHNDYYFYVTKKDETGEHYFARTYEEHIANKNKSEKN